MFYNFSSVNSIRKREQKKTDNDIFEEYVGSCYALGIPPTLSGLCLELGYPTLKAFRDACDTKEEYQYFVMKIQKHYEENLTKQGGSSAGAQFALTSMFGWKDEKNIVVTNAASDDDLKEMTSEQLRAMLK